MSNKNARENLDANYLNSVYVTPVPKTITDLKNRSSVWDYIRPDVTKQSFQTVINPLVHALNLPPSYRIVATELIIASIVLKY